MPQRMTSVIVPRFGGPEVYESTDVALPEPGPGQVLVRLRTSGVNFLDVAQRRGTTALPAPFAAGVEGVGEVVASGALGGAPVVGRRVGWLAGGQGSFSEYALVAGDKVVAIPDAVDDDVAVSLLMQGITAQYLTTSTYPVSTGDVVLVHAAAGGLGQLVTQLAKLRGATVIGTASTAHKAEIARANGADFVFTYDDFVARTAEVTDGAGVHVVYDGVGATTVAGSLDALRIRGTLVVVGSASGPVPPIDIGRLNAGSLSVTRPTVVHHIRTPEELGARAAEVFALAASGRITTHIGGRYDIADVAEAFRALESRGTTGKLVLTHGARSPRTAR